MSEHTPRKIGQQIAVTIEDGQPLCPHCGLPMIGQPLDDGETWWECPTWVAARPALAEAIRDHIDPIVLGEEPT